MNVPVSYVDPPTVPEGMTLREWSRQRRAAAPPRRIPLRRRLRGFRRSLLR